MVFLVERKFSCVIFIWFKGEGEFYDRRRKGWLRKVGKEEVLCMTNGERWMVWGICLWKGGIKEDDGVFGCKVGMWKAWILGF